MIGPVCAIPACGRTDDLELVLLGPVSLHACRDHGADVARIGREQGAPGTEWSLTLSDGEVLDGQGVIRIMPADRTP